MTKRRVVSIVAMIATLTISIGIGASPSSSESTIRKLVDEWAQVPVNRDFTVLEKVLAEKYIGVSPSGKIRTKADVIALHRKDTEKYSAAANENVTVHFVSSDIAVVAGRYAEMGSTSGGKKFQRCYRFSDTFAREGTKWRCVASHTTLISEQ